MSNSSLSKRDCQLRLLTAKEESQTSTRGGRDAEVGRTAEQQKPSRKSQQHHKQQQQNHQQVQTSDYISKLFADCALYLIRAIISIYTLSTLPVYYLIHKRRRDSISRRQWSQQLDPNDPCSPWTQTNNDPKLRELEARVDSVETYDELMRRAFIEHSKLPCYAYREVLQEEWSKRPGSDKPIRKVKLTDFKWVTYGQFDAQLEVAKMGFLLEGIESGDMVALYADTRAEWQLACQALIRLGAIVVTMNSLLGVDAIVHIINETEVKHMVTQQDKVKKLLDLKCKLPTLKKITFFEPVPRFESGESSSGKLGEELEELAAREGVQCISFNELFSQGSRSDEQTIENLWKKSEKAHARRTKDSTLVLMYTSGSTGVPKGAVLSHGNIMANIKSFSSVKQFVDNPYENIYAAYLPLAHIFEFTFESAMLYHGVRIGFASPQTLTDISPGLIKGQAGDLSLLKPTLLIIVPLILERVVQSVKETLKSQSYFKQKLMTHLIEYKIYWQRHYYDTPLIDRTVCPALSKVLGGRVKHAICGSAPLSSRSHRFMRAAFNMKMGQGYGSTETCAAVAVQSLEDQSTCVIGPPLPGVQIKLEPWIEGNYKPTDKPHPRGEIVVSGGMITRGYYKLDEQTREAFYLDREGGRWWYRTGDIGEFLPNGNLRIIDRKKDLVKLQNGEYVSLGKVESTLKANPYTDNFCVYANSNYDHVIALGPANETALKTLAQRVVDEFRLKEEPDEDQVDQQRVAAIELLEDVLSSYQLDDLNNNSKQEEGKVSLLNSNPNCSVDKRLEILCNSPLIQDRVLSDIRQLAKKTDLFGFETPRKMLLLAEEWTEDKNLVTAAMKVRRNNIYKLYAQQLAELYKQT